MVCPLSTDPDHVLLLTLHGPDRDIEWAHHTTIKIKNRLATRSQKSPIIIIVPMTLVLDNVRVHKTLVSEKFVVNVSAYCTVSHTNKKFV